MKASELISSVDILKKIEQKENELAKISEKLNGEITALMMELPPNIKNALLEKESRAAANGKTKKPRISKEETLDKVREALMDNKGQKMRKNEIMEKTGFDENRVNNALFQLKNEIDRVPADDKLPLSKRNTAYKLKKGKK